MTETVEFKDFSRPPREVKFQVGNSTYKALPAIPLGLAMSMGKFKSMINGGAEDPDALKPLWDFFDAILLDDGGHRIQIQASDKSDPLDVVQLKDIMNWLLEVYGLRPTQPSSPSSTGSEDSGTSSTDGALAVESIPSS